MDLSRRAFLAAAGASGVSLATSPAPAAELPLPLTVAVRSPWMANQVALTSDNVLFLGLPRYARDKPTPSLARRDPDGTLRPFPGNGWNTWAPGGDGREAFVYLNAVHIFADDTVWCVDQGSLSPDAFPREYATPQPGAQKLVQLDARSGEIIRILRSDDTILSAGAQMNDRRLHGSMLYVTDSGLGGIIAHNLATGTTMRRLAGTRVVEAIATDIPPILAQVQGGKTFHPPNSDMIEITADGRWLYWAAPTGPLYRIDKRYLNDPAASDDDLLGHVEHVFDNRFAGGCSMDSVGNIYFSETATQHIAMLAPSGRTAVLTSDPALIRPDGSFISRDRHLYIPVKQAVASTPAGTARVPSPPHFNIYALALPRRSNGIAIGDQVTGAALRMDGGMVRSIM